MRTLKFDEKIPAYGDAKNSDVHIIAVHGSPSVPYLIYNYLLPYGYDIRDISVSFSKIKFSEGVQISAGVADIPLDGSVLELPEYWENPEIYDKDGYFPEVLYENLGITYARGHAILGIALYPYQYNPKTSNLISYESCSITIKLDLSYKKRKKEREYLVKNKKTLSLISQIVRNPDEMDTYIYEKEDIRLSGGSSDVTLSDPDDPYSMIILTSKTIFEAADDVYGVHAYAQWKNDHGLKTKVVNVHDVYSSGYYDYLPASWDEYATTPSLDKQIKIRNYLRDAVIKYNQNVNTHDTPLEYVMLCGTTTATSQASTDVMLRGSNAGHNTPILIYYSCLEEPDPPNDFFIEGHALYGASSSKANYNLSPTISISRIDRASSDTPETFYNMFEKFKRYYRESRNNNLMVVTGDNTSTGVEGVINYIAPHIPSGTNCIYQEISGTNCPPEQSAINWNGYEANPALAVFYGHDGTFMTAILRYSDTDNIASTNGGIILCHTCPLWSSLSYNIKNSIYGFSGALCSTIEQWTSGFRTVVRYAFKHMFENDIPDIGLAVGLGIWETWHNAGTTFITNTEKRPMWGLHYCGDPSLCIKGDFVNWELKDREYLDTSPVAGDNEYTITTKFKYKDRWLESEVSEPLKITI